MTRARQDILRKKRVFEHAERIGKICKACRYYGVSRSAFYLWKKAYGDVGLINKKPYPVNLKLRTPPQRAWQSAPTGRQSLGEPTGSSFLQSASEQATRPRRSPIWIPRQNWASEQPTRSTSVAGGVPSHRSATSRTWSSSESCVAASSAA